MIPKELAIALIICACIIAFLYTKMILIWRDVMLKQHEKLTKEFNKLHTN